jgi:hypothetical protein
MRGWAVPRTKARIGPGSSVGISDLDARILVSLAHSASEASHASLASTNVLSPRLARVLRASAASRRALARFARRLKTFPFGFFSWALRRTFAHTTTVARRRVQERLAFARTPFSARLLATLFGKGAVMISALLRSLFSAHLAAWPSDYTTARFHRCGVTASIPQASIRLRGPPRCRSCSRRDTVRRGFCLNRGTGKAGPFASTISG